MGKCESPVTSSGLTEDPKLGGPIISRKGDKTGLNQQNCLKTCSINATPEPLLCSLQLDNYLFPSQQNSGVVVFSENGIQKVSKLGKPSTMISVNRATK